ncbi:MAG: trigger factor [Planctomycetaceae bacterium]|nr:trigger factor [Planctomycetales bacterium]MCB9875198.1 trigger factor [Planctomycetaceae bacterium]MCB9936786.1 trigger factor [Planctomycetaceae bacterium]
MATPDTELAPEEASEQGKPKLALEVKVDKPSACQRHVTVTVAKDDIERYFKEAFDDLAPKAEVPGFRPGRAPRKLVESRFREQMSNQVKGSLLMDSVTQASEDCDFSAISEPDFDFEAIELPDDGPMTFEFDIEVRPEFDMPEWKGLKLERQDHEYTDEEVTEHLTGLLARYGHMVEKSGAAEAGDHITLNIIFKDGDEELSRVEDYTVEIKPTLSFSDGNIEGFDKLVIGSKVGDHHEIKIKISDEAEKESLRGKEVSADIEITEVRRLELPAMSPAFLDRIGGFEDEEELRDAVRGELERQLTYHQQRKIRQQITAVLTKDANWELPPDMLRRQGRRELERAVLELRSSGFADDVIRQHQNQLRQNSLASTERALKEHFIFERLAEDHEIDAEPSDYDAEILLIARQSNESSRRIRARLEKRGQMDALRNQIIERKVIDLITSEAEFKDIPFEAEKNETVAIDHAISGFEHEDEIPEAKYGGDTEELRTPSERG